MSRMTDRNNASTDTVRVRRTVALVDGFTGGHHLTHLRHYAKALLELGHEVWVFLPDPDPVAAWLQEEMPDPGDGIQFYPFVHVEPSAPCWRLRKLVVPFRTWRHVAQAVASASRHTGRKPDLVFFNWLDDYILGDMAGMAGLHRWVFPYRWSGVFFHPWHLRAPAGDAARTYVAAERLLKLPACPGVAVLDAGVRATLEGRLGKPVFAFPDETDESILSIPSRLVHHIRERARGRKVIGLVGELSRRKGIVSFLRAARRAPDWFFLLAGEFGPRQRATLYPDERAFVEQSIAAGHDHVMLSDRRIEDEREFNAVIAACDALYAAYTTFGHSSGIVTKAAVFEKPILVSPGYYMAEVVERYRLGVAVEPEDTTRVVDALSLLLDADRFRHEVGASRFEACRHQHAYVRLLAAFEALLRRLES